MSKQTLYTSLGIGALIVAATLVFASLRHGPARARSEARMLEVVAAVETVADQGDIIAGSLLHDHADGVAAVFPRGTAAFLRGGNGFGDRGLHTRRLSNRRPHKQITKVTGGVAAEWRPGRRALLNPVSRNGLDGVPHWLL